jgi:phage shock protein PspC (stress-responsive transcriptional regulator)
MNRVITISLNGNAYQLEESGYEALRAYLAQAENRLRDNPDKSEIMSDLEQAIAEKCSRYLNPQKSVVAGSEIERILKDMGPVDPPSDSADAGASTSGATGPTPGGESTHKRLYQISEGAMISGVCNGFAAYFNVDVTIVRIIFVVLALLTGGGWILAYVVMMFVIPFANTSEERAAAHGLPFNARELIERAKKQYEEFRAKHDWRQQRSHWRGEWREQRRTWRQQQREWRRHWRHDWDMRTRWAPPETPRPTSYAARVVAGVLVPVFGILSAAMFVAWLIALVSLASTGTILGWPLPIGIPLWAAFIIVTIAYGAISAPLRAAKYASYSIAGGQSPIWYGFGDALVRLAFIALFIWIAYHYIPAIHALIDGLPHFGNEVAHQTTAMVSYFFPTA